MMKQFKNNKAFTLIELLVVIVVLAILVLLAAPKLLNYIDEAELARIQHDTKVMENKMAEILNQPQDNYNNWDDNGKDLGTLVLKNQLFEKEGLATAVNMKHLTHGGNKFTNLNKSYEGIGIGGDLYKMSEKLGTGGENYGLGPSSGYKIIPESFKKTIGTHLDGTFYVNKLGKVYYEPNKPIRSVKQDQPLACVAAETLDYEFDSSTGTIIKYNGTLQYIIIPSAFEVDGECVPVRVIGKGAFMRGEFKIEDVKIPQSVKEIQEDAFKENELTEIEIPHSVDIIGENAFSNNKIEIVVINKSSNDIIVGDGAFSNNGPSGTSNINPIYKTPTAGDLNIVFDKSTGSIVSSFGGSSGGNYGGSSGSSGSSGGGYNNSNRVISIPKTIEVDGEEHEIKEISKGSFQGQGIIYVEFPDSLERIEDYAFAGNQLIGVKVPNQIGYIGNYAFSFNEVNGKETINYVEILSRDQKSNIDNFGNIANNGVKVDILDNKVNLLDHIFITSAAKFKIPEEYNPITKNANSEIPSKPQVTGISDASATVNGGPGTEVTIDGIEWHSSPYVFSDLSEGESYVAYSRYKETTTNYASEMSEATSFNTIVISREPVDFESIGAFNTFKAPVSGAYKLEVWGAQGTKKCTGSSCAEGLGGYSVGQVVLEKDEELYVYVGGQGKGTSGGWNGGGSSAEEGTGGGGATDIRTINGSWNISNSLQSRIIVAGGGGGSSGGSYPGKPGGGVSTSINNVLGTGTSKPYLSGGNNQRASAGGGGYYGGSASSSNGYSGGGGGSGYIGGVQSGLTISGDRSMPNPDGSTMIGRKGNGFAKITYIGK